MDIIALKADDADKWVYRGEGAVNLVLAYIGSSPQFVGKVLRIPKIPRNKPESEDGSSAFTIYERHLWEDVIDISPDSRKEIVGQMFAQHVMAPSLGTGHVDAGISIPVSREFLEAVENNALPQRPSWRVAAAKVNSLYNSALLMNDHSVFPCGGQKEQFCISVEIKPKCGFLPLSRFVADENVVKRSVTRFRMHQALKLNQGKISEISEYDPLDMFSGSKERVHKAIKALFLTPQNNFRVFLNGSLIFGELGGGADNTSCFVGKAFEDSLKSVILADDEMRVTAFLELVAEAVYESALLDRLLQVQKLDVVDIEGAIHAYYDIVSQPCLVCRDLVKTKLHERYSSLHSLPLNESLKIVRDYLIAATAKDLSMMISFRPRVNLHLESPYGVVSLGSTNQSFDYKVSFIDLDMKSLKKMEYYYQLDQQIVSCYSKMAKQDDYDLEKTARTKETLYLN